MSLILALVQFIGMKLNFTNYSAFEYILYMLAGGGIGYIILKTQRK